MSVVRPTVEVPSPAGGWGYPWPNVAEVADALSHEDWTLIGGLMVQVHAIHHGIGVVRPTNDVDIVVHIETGRGRPDKVAGVLGRLGYELRPATSSRKQIAHRFQRGRDTVDVVIAEHAAPFVIESMMGNQMVPIEGGTQALRRTLNARLEIVTGRLTTISVPDPFGALVLKSAAHKTDSRDRDRHLLDAVVLLASVDDPYAELERPASGSDRSRLLYLGGLLADPLHPAWFQLDSSARSDAQVALQILVDG